MVEADLERAEERAETGESYVYFLFNLSKELLLLFFFRPD